MQFTHDTAAMTYAATLALRGRGRVEPNPMVGAVVLDHQGHLVGEGFHEVFGGPHAEIHALRQAGAKSRGATLVCTLEPCSHHGKTPPCVDAIIEAGIERVVVGMVDPHDQVNGKGIERLQLSGIDVHTGILEESLRRLNAPFVKLMMQAKPYVILKWAMTMDGRIASSQGDSKWISGDLSRLRVHDLRGRVDAIITGIGTVQADDPHLTARPEQSENILRHATRVVVDSRGQIEPSSNLFENLEIHPTLIATTSQMSPEKHQLLISRGAEVLELPAIENRVDLDALLAALGQRRMTNVLVEAGPNLAAGFWEARQVDEVHIYVGPKIIGGKLAPGPLGGKGMDLMQDAGIMKLEHVEQLGDDVHLQYGRLPDV